MSAVANNQIVKFVSNQQIIHRVVLSNSFNIICEKITLNDQVCLVAKYYNKKTGIYHILHKFWYTHVSISF